MKNTEQGGKSIKKKEFSLSDFHIDYKLEKHKPRGGPCRTPCSTSGVAILMN